MKVNNIVPQDNFHVDELVIDPFGLVTNPIFNQNMKYYCINKDLSTKNKFMTKDIKIPYNSHFKSLFSDKKLILKKSSDIGMNSLINDVLIPLDQIMMRRDIKKKICGNENNSEYSPIVRDKNYISFNASYAKIYVTNKNGVVDTNDIVNDINDVTLYLNRWSKIKFVLNIGKIWRMKMQDKYKYGVRLTCDAIIIMHGKTKENSVSELIKAYTLLEAKEKKKESGESGEIELIL